MKRVFLPIVAMAVCLAPFCRGANPLDQWNWRNPLPQGNDLKGVCYGDSGFVAVGWGSVLTSMDGSTWKLQTFDTSIRLNAVTYGNGLYVAVGARGTILTSNNGTTWSQSTWGTTDLVGIAYGGGQFVAVSSSARKPLTILTSDDGLAWSPRSIPIPTSAEWGWLSDVAYGGGHFVAVGFYFVSGNFYPRHPLAYASDDGVTWTLLYDVPGEPSKIAYGAGQFVITTLVGNVTLTLTNETALWGRGPETLGGLTGVTYYNGRFLAIRPSGRMVVTSTNGSNWSVAGRATDNPTSYLLGIAAGPHAIVAVGTYGEIITSPEGVSWTQRSAGTWDSFSSVAYGNGRFVAVRNSQEPIFLTSTDGVGWTVQKSGTNVSVGALAFGGGRFVGVGGSGAIATSADGVTWNPQLSGTTWDLLGVEYWSGQYVVVGDKGTILTSLDGTNWNSRDSGTSNALVSLAGGADAVVAVGFGGTVFTSTNGIVWSSQKVVPSVSSIFGIAYGNGRFVAAGGEYQGLVWTCVDGSNWTPSTGAGVYVNAIWYAAGHFVAAGGLAEGGGALVTSADGVSWTKPRLVTSHSLRDLAFGGDTVVIVGGNGAILQSGSFPRFGPLSMGPGGMEGTITASIGQSLQVQVSTNLESWVTLTNLASTNASAQFLDSEAANFNRRFYRAVVRSQ